MDENTKYDPRIGYEYVPAFLVTIMMLMKCFAFISPYIAALWLQDKNVGLILSITSDDTYNMLLATLIGYFIRDKIGKGQPRA